MTKTHPAFTPPAPPLRGVRYDPKMFARSVARSSESLGVFTPSEIDLIVSYLAETIVSRGNITLGFYTFWWAHSPEGIEYWDFVSSHPRTYDALQWPERLENMIAQLRIKQYAL